MKAHTPQNKNAAAVIIGLSLDIGISQEEYRQDDHDNVPAREDETRNRFQPVKKTISGSKNKN